jgi:hypothetical protein
MATVKSGINKVGNNYYQSIIKDNVDGSVGTTFYRVNPDGSGEVPIYDVLKSTDSPSLVKSFDANASAEEQRLLSDPNSQLSQVRSQQVTSSNPYTNPSPNQNSTLAQAGGGSGNAATTASNPDSQGGSTPTSALSPTQGQSSGGGEILYYPLEMQKTQQDRIKFTAVEYIPTGNLQAGTISSQNRTSLQGKKPLGAVFLPIQAGISDFNSVEWSTGNLNEIQKLALNTSLASMNADNVGEVGNAFKEAGNKVINDLKQNSREAQVYLAQEAISIQNLLSRFGTVLNPNLELLFSGPAIRPFDFTFKLSAREKREADNIKKIINFFKKNMAVKKSDGTAIFLKAPNTFLIEYKYNGSVDLHPAINKIKECALISCSVQYTPNGTYMTYPDGTMVSYSMTLSFQELEPIYNTDYDTPHPIGY